MLNYLLSLLGLTLLCAAWMVFQIWYKRENPERDSFSPGCGGCKGGSCAAPQSKRARPDAEQ